MITDKDKLTTDKDNMTTNSDEASSDTDQVGSHTGGFILNTEEKPSSPGFTVWMDADACPKEVRAIVFRAVFRLQLRIEVVANCAIPTPQGSLIKCTIVEKGPDVADQYIIDAVKERDIVITADIPLAKEVVKKGAVAIDIRGTLYNDNNIGERCAVRDLLHELREDGMRLGGPNPFGKKDKQKFADTFDRMVNQRIKEEKLKAIL
jgi:hypothetical protein